MTEERVVLIDGDDRAIGSAEKLDAHRRGLLHRAFSIFVERPNGSLLLQRRALTKYHTPGVWSNTCCGHPRPGETILEAARRRLDEEMGLTCPLRRVGSIRYRAELENGLVEHEIDHVLTGVSTAPPLPASSEVAEWRWVNPLSLGRELRRHPLRFAPWFRVALEVRDAAGPVSSGV